MKQKSLAREILENLEAEGSYLFHGAMNPDLKTLEPRQAYNFIGVEHIADDKPAVHASPLADVAIFVGMMNEYNCPKGYDTSCGNEGEDIIFAATQVTLDQLNENSRGYVYVVPKDSFTPRSIAESISYSSVIPIQVVEVRKSDLPKNIKIKQ